MEKIKLDVCGNIFGIDGYASHTKSLLNALLKNKDLDIKLNSQLPKDWVKNVTTEQLQCITKPDRKEDWNLIITTPHYWKLFLGLGKNACYCVWEGDKVPLSWISEFQNPKVDLILVPSSHTLSAILFTCELAGVNTEEIQKKIKVMPHGVDRDIFYSREVKKDGSFTFICNKGWRGTPWDRGGVQYVLKAFAEEFSKNENVKLIIKLNPAYIDPNIIKQAVDNLKLAINRAPIQVVSDFLPPTKLCDLYNMSDCFICATRAEAFNLPGLEAMSCGIPTIQTSYGGQVDYMNDKNSLFISYDLSESEETPAYEGIKWANPKIEDIKKQMRWAFNNQDKIKEMGKQAEIDSKQWTWDESSRKLVEILCLSPSDKRKQKSNIKV